MNNKSKFKLDIQHTFKNKTLSYVYPCMKEWPTFSYFNNNVNVAGVAIGDGTHDINYLENDYLYIVVNITNKSNIRYGQVVNSDYDFRNFMLIMEEVRNQEWFVEDYPFLYDNTIDQYHMIVARLPDTVKGIKFPFIKGTYSEMYEKSQILKYIRKTYEKDAKEYFTLPFLVLSKHESYRQSFANILKNDFDTDVVVDETYELDYPPTKACEVINYDFVISKDKTW